MTKPKRIPVDTVWKTVTVRGKEYVVPDFKAMRNAVRKKIEDL